MASATARGGERRREFREFEAKVKSFGDLGLILRIRERLEEGREELQGLKGLEKEMAAASIVLLFVFALALVFTKIRFSNIFLWFFFCFFFAFISLTFLFYENHPNFFILHAYI